MFKQKRITNRPIGQKNCGWTVECDSGLKSERESIDNRHTRTKEAITGQEVDKLGWEGENSKKDAIELKKKQLEVNFTQSGLLSVLMLLKHKNALEQSAKKCERTRKKEFLENYRNRGLNECFDDKRERKRVRKELEKVCDNIFETVQE